MLQMVTAFSNPLNEFSRLGMFVLHPCFVSSEWVATAMRYICYIEEAGWQQFMVDT
jgi:hypothetical protein